MKGIKTRLFLLSVLMMISLASFGQNIRGFYLQDVGDWLGNSTKENEILSYAQSNGFNYLLFYDLGDINWGSSTEKNQLGAFMTKARSQYGIIQIGGVVEYAGYLSQNILPYNNSRTSNSQKFDVINQEFEFWVSSSISNSYCDKFLRAAGFTCDKAGAWAFAWREFKKIDDLCTANGLISEYYLGWPSLSQMQQLAGRADRILLSAYRPDDSDIYTYSKQRMKDIASIGGTTEVLTLLSSQSTFMGPWLQTHPQTRPFQTMRTALDNETGSFKDNIDLQGYHYFTYKYLPHTSLATASISASGPLTFCPGGSVTLTANSGSAYLWSPGGQTTRSITVSNPGSYKVKVTNNSVQVTSSAVVVSNSGTGSAPAITASGPTSFCPGGSVTLTSSSASSYDWSSGQTTQSITVTQSGTYRVTTGGNCGGTSSPVTVNAVAAPSVPTITSSGLNVCPGTVVTLTSSAANGYLWSNGATTRSIAVSAAGGYSVRAYSGPSCSALSTTKTVTLLTAPATPTIAKTGSTTLTTTNPSVVLTSSTASAYDWTTGASTRSITVTAQGSYRVTISGSNGCKATSSTVLVTANGCVPPAAPTIQVSGSSIIVSGQSVTLTCSATTGGVRWSTGQTTRSITVNTPGVYTVRNYNGGNCFSTSLPKTVTVLLPRMDSPNDASVAEERFNAYPNPVHDLLNIEFNRTREENISIRLIDISGREVQVQEITSTVGPNKVQLDVSSLPKGIYFAFLISANEKQSLKVIVD